MHKWGAVTRKYVLPLSCSDETNTMKSLTYLHIRCPDIIFGFAFQFLAKINIKSAKICT